MKVLLDERNTLRSELTTKDRVIEELWKDNKVNVHNCVAMYVRYKPATT